MKSNLLLSFKKGKVYTGDGVNYYRFIGITTRYVFDKVEFNARCNRYITTYNTCIFTANTAALLVEV